MFGYRHLRQQLLALHLTDRPALPAELCRPRLKVHLTGELVPQLHAEPAGAAVAPVGAGEVEGQVYEVDAGVFGPQRMMLRVEVKQVSSGRPVAVLHHIPGHGAIC